MWRTRVGYAGGTKESPTYRSIGNHSECIEIEFDPEVVSYDELLEMFWASHDPSSRPFSSQYKSMILASNDAQLAAAKASAERYERATGKKVLTEIEKLERFYPAEDYHQKYGLRSDARLMSEFESMYPDGAEFAGSTAAARVNGYVSGQGSAESLARDIEGLGLTSEGRERIESLFGAADAACAIPIP